MLRKLTEADLSLILTWRNQPEVRRFMYSSKEISEVEHHAWFARMNENQESKWFIHENPKGGATGVVYFTNFKSGQNTAFWGFYAAPDAPSGTGTRIGFEALTIAFDEFGLHKLSGESLAANEKSIRLHRKLGFKDEGLFRESHFDGEHYVDVVRFGILSREWEIQQTLVWDYLTKFEAN